MSKVRINDLARELEVKSKAILDVLLEVGVTEKKTHSSSIEDHEAVKVRAHFRATASEAPSSASRRVPAAPRATKSRPRSIFPIFPARRCSECHPETASTSGRSCRTLSGARAPAVANPARSQPCCSEGCRAYSRRQRRHRQLAPDQPPQSNRLSRLQHRAQCSSPWLPATGSAAGVCRVRRSLRLRPLSTPPVGAKRRLQTTAHAVQQPHCRRAPSCRRPALARSTRRRSDPRPPTAQAGAPVRSVPGRPVPGQPIFQRPRPAAPTGPRPPLRPGERRPMHPTRHVAHRQPSAGSRAGNCRRRVPLVPAAVRAVRRAGPGSATFRAA